MVNPCKKINKNALLNAPFVFWQIKHDKVPSRNPIHIQLETDFIFSTPSPPLMRSRYSQIQKEEKG